MTIKESVVSSSIFSGPPCILLFNFNQFLMDVDFVFIDLLQICIFFSLNNVGLSYEKLREFLY